VSCGVIAAFMCGGSQVHRMHEEHRICTIGLAIKHDAHEA